MHSFGPDLELQEAHQRYQGYRDAAFHMTWEGIKDVIPECDIGILPIDQSALAEWGAYHPPDMISDNGGFPWDEIFQQLRTTPRRFDVAIWGDGLLRGLAAGKASRGKENMTLTWAESFCLENDPLKGYIADTVVTAADHYAKILGCQYLMLRNPLQGAIPRWEKLGFSLVSMKGRCTYYSRKVI